MYYNMAMRRRVLVFYVLLCFAVILSGCVEKEKTSFYENSALNFSVVVPTGYGRMDISAQGRQEGIELKKDQGTIIVRAIVLGANFFEKLPPAETFFSDYGIRGYKISQDVMGPIYYFPPAGGQALEPQLAEAIVISGDDDNLAKDAELIARSFRHLDVYKDLFWKKDHGKEFVVTKDKVFEVLLPANPTTGFKWEFKDLNQDCFQVLSSGFMPPKQGIVGAGGISWWEVRPLKSGMESIRLLYYRPWEGKEKAEEEYQVTLLVK